MTSLERIVEVGKILNKGNGIISPRMLKTRFSLSTITEAGEILEDFYSKYQKKFIGLFLVTFESEGKLNVELVASNSEKSKLSTINFFLTACRVLER
jgi:hypothetical protein